MITNLIKEEEDDKLRRAIVRGVASIIRSMMLVMLYKTIIFQSCLTFDHDQDAKLASFLKTFCFPGQLLWN